MCEKRRQRGGNIPDAITRRKGQVPLQPLAETSENPEQVREMCVSRLKRLQDYVKQCLANFELNTRIPPDLVNRAEDTITAVFGTSSRNGTLQSLQRPGEFIRQGHQEELS